MPEQDRVEEMATGQVEQPDPERSLPRQLDLLLARLADVPVVWVRMAASWNQNDRSWHFGFLEVITGAPPDEWAEATWEYSEAVLSAVNVPGLTVAEWFHARELKIGSITVPLAPQHDVRSDRRGSDVVTIYQPLVWPSVTWTAQAQDGGVASYGELVADGAPAFLNFDLAFAAFFHLPDRNRVRMDMQQIVFREQDRRARIKEVTVTATDVTVMVDGDERAGKRLTLGGPSGRSQILDDHVFGVTFQEVSFELPDGVDEGAWIALHDGRELLDSRVLDPRWQPAGSVKFEVDPAVRLETMISGGENVRFEAKRELPGSDPDRVMKTVAAFANGSGGTIIFGVDNQMQVVGLGDALNRESIDRVTSLVSDRVHPHVFFAFEEVVLRDERVLALHISSGSDAPYGVGTNEQQLKFYVRRSGSTIPARPEDLRNSVLARAPQITDPIIPRAFP